MVVRKTKRRPQEIGVNEITIKSDLSIEDEQKNLRKGGTKQK
jgi:hypothetical protein